MLILQSMLQKLREFCFQSVDRISYAGRVTVLELSDLSHFERVM